MGRLRLFRLSLSAFVGMCYLGTAHSATELCNRQTFQPQCAPGEVIVMLSAVYGRMKKGQCISSDFRIGCSADALLFMDRRCSGLPTCTFTLDFLNEDLQKISECPTDVVSYMEIDYECVQVISNNGRRCSAAADVKIGQSGAVLASYLADATGCGSPRAPWRITGQPGQRIDISMLNFNWATVEDTSQLSFGGTKCDAVGFIVDGSLGINKTICSRSARQGHIYTTSSSAADVIVTTATGEDSRAFLLQITVTGCPDVEAPEYAWYKRNGDIAEIGCEWNHNTWKLKCENNVWVGVVGNCSGPGITVQSSEVVEPLKLALSSVVTVALIVGLGTLALILLCVLVIGLIYFRRRTPQSNYEMQPQVKPSDQVTTDKRYQNIPHEIPPCLSDGVCSTAGHPRPMSQQSCGTGSPGQQPLLLDDPAMWERSLPPPPPGQPIWDRQATIPVTNRDTGTQSRRPKMADNSDEDSSEYYWSGTHKYHVLEKDK